MSERYIIVVSSSSIDSSKYYFESSSSSLDVDLSTMQGSYSVSIMASHALGTSLPSSSVLFSVPSDVASASAQPDTPILWIGGSTGGSITLIWGNNGVVGGNGVNMIYRLAMGN